MRLRTSTVVLLSTLLAVSGCAETTREKNSDSGDNTASSEPQTVVDGVGGEAECGGPGPFAPADALTDEADILEVTASPSGDTLTVEIKYAGNAEAASASPGNAYTMVAKTTDGTVVDVLQTETGWKVVDGVASVAGTWTAEDTLRLVISGVPGPVEQVTVGTFGSTDGEYWCDRAVITF